MLNIIIVSAIVANTLGIALHYTHNRKTKSFLIHSISAVNESTWEHLKLAFMPMLFISFVQYLLLSNRYNNILEANTMGILLTLVLIPGLYYPIRYLIKKEVVLVSIALFITDIVLGYVLVYRYLEQGTTILGEQISVIILFVISVLFITFTKNPPKFFLFKDPVSKKYGDK